MAQVELSLRVCVCVIEAALQVGVPVAQRSRVAFACRLLLAALQVGGPCVAQANISKLGTSMQL